MVAIYYIFNIYIYIYVYYVSKLLSLVPDDAFPLGQVPLALYALVQEQRKREEERTRLRRAARLRKKVVEYLPFGRR